MSNPRNFGTQEEGILPEIIKIVKIGLQHISHGFVAFIGYTILYYYIEILFMNLAYGNRIAFIPFLLPLLTPLLLIILGAMNSYALKLIYHQRTSQHWSSLISQGFFIGLTGFLLSFFWTYLFFVVILQLLRLPGMYASGPFMVVIFFYIPFILFVPTLGYAVKALSSYFTGIKSEEFQKDEQRLDVSPKNGAN